LKICIENNFSYTEFHGDKKEFHRERNQIMEISLITEKIIGCAIDLHRNLGPGLLESAYEECLAYELRNSGLNVERQKQVPVVYKEIKLRLWVQN
jgi:hypothetical protein